jgi:GGDEF domain-containing protein
MTVPFQYPDYNKTLGTESPVADSEWNTMLSRRTQLVGDIENRLQLANVIRKTDPTVAMTPGLDIQHADHTAQQHQLYGTNADGTPTQFQAFHEPPHQEELNRLYGAADFWNIPNAREMAPEQLKQLIELKRVANEGGISPFMGMSPDDEIRAKTAAAMGLGATQGLIEMAQHIPFIGHAVAENETVQSASQFLAKLNEGVQMGMTQDERKGWRIAHGLGGVLGYIVPGDAAWNMAGAIGKLGALGKAGSLGRLVTSPIARGAIQGATASWFLEGGGDQSNQEAAIKVGIGGASAGAFTALGEALPRVFEKARSAFKSRTDPLNSADIDPAYDWSRKGETVDAEWYFEADHQLDKLQHPALGGGGPEGPSGPGGGTGPSPDAPFGSDPFTVDPSLRGGAPAAEATGMQYGTTPAPIHPEIAAHIAELTEQRDVARRLLETDPLTGLGNKTALERARGTVDADPDLGWAVFDGKKFKAVNDTHGHDVGDQVLQNFGRAINQAAAEMNIPARGFRQGGDEFAAAVPRAQLDAFTRRVGELSYQKVGGVETRLDGYHASEFAEADLSLMANKRQGTPTQITPSNQVEPTPAPSIQQASELPSYQPSGTSFWSGRPVEVPQVQSEGNQLNLTSEQALSEASNLTKQAQIMEGDVASLAHVGELDESDVATAALFRNPERINVVQGIGDAGKTIRKLTQGMTEGRIMPHQFRFVERNGQMDMLVSDGLPITSKRVAQYKEHGFFDGQQVVANGRSTAILRAAEAPGMARVYDPYSEQSYLVPHEQIQPGRASGADTQGLSEQGDALYNRFRQGVEQYMTNEVGKLPPGTKVDTSWLSSETSSQLPRLLNQFLDAHVGQSQLSRAALESYFNVRRVQDFKALAPEETAQLASMNKELSIVRAANPQEHFGVEDQATTKGFAYVPTPGEAGGTLVDRISDLRVPVADEEAASTFLQSFNRELPDYTPISDVPVEVMGSNPHAANPGNDLEPVLERGAEAEYNLTKAAGDEIEAITNRGIGAPTQPPAGGAPPPPPRDFSLGGAPDRPSLPPGPRSLGAQFAEAARSRPTELYRIQQRFDSAWLNYMVPFRSVALQVENDLKNIGISEGTLWKHYNDVVTNVTRAHNEALPWQAEWADITSQFRRRLLRTGTVTKIQEIVGYNQQLDAMKKAGYSLQEISAQKRLADFNDRFFQYLVDDPNYKLDASRYIAGYMSHVRQRQGMPGISDPFADTNNVLPMELKFFAEMAREGNMQFRQLDARSLGTKMIRAAMFKKHVGESYETMARAWSDPRIPTEFRDVARDWLDVVRTGHNPHYDLMIQGGRHFFNAMGVPITNGEMATLSNVAFGNMYRAQLGGRPDAIFRDSIQPFFTGVRIGFTPVIQAYNTLLTGGQTTRDMIQRGLEGGWLEKGMAKVANADVFEHGVNTPEGTSLLTPEQQNRREMLAKVGDAIWATTPKSLRNGLQGSRLDPLHYYTKLGEVNRVVSGEAGYQLAASALADYQFEMGKLMRGELDRAKGVMWLDSADSLMNQLLKSSKARVYPQPIQDEFKRLVSNGEMQEAAYLLANEAANMQFRYGAKENPIGIRKMGNTGRAIMQFGTFTQQYIAQMREMASGPGVHPEEKVAMLTRYGTVSAALALASAYTGWNFSKWAWHQSLTFAGGPVFQGLQQGVQAITGAAAAGMGAPQTPSQKAAVETFSRTTPGDVLGGIAASEFPYSSSSRTLSHVYDSITGMNPVEGTARTLITGETGVQPDIAQWVEQMGGRVMDPGADWRQHLRPGVLAPGAGAQ